MSDVVPVPVPDPEFGAAVCAALRAQAGRLGLSLGDEPAWEQAAFKTVVDPFSQERSVLAVWSGQARYGTATFFPSGKVFAEYQVLLPHPAQQGAYVESVQVWGDRNKLRGDANIAEYPA